MKKVEKHQVLNALVSEIIYASKETKKITCSYSLKSGHGKVYVDLYHKLNKDFFKNDSEIYNANIKYFNEKMKEVQV